MQFIIRAAAQYVRSLWPDLMPSWTSAVYQKCPRSARIVLVGACLVLTCSPGRAQTADQVRSAQAAAADQVSRFRSSYATKLQFDYVLDSKSARDPFLVSAIYHDDSFTYIQCAAREKPALYEVKDGKPNLISFQFENGVYIAPKIMDSGYLVIGKKKLLFARRVAAN